jgi:hypothetical protein
MILVSLDFERCTMSLFKRPVASFSLFTWLLLGSGLLAPLTLGGEPANVSTRGFVGTGDEVLIGGAIIVGPGPVSVVVRALGPTLGEPPFNVAGALPNPQLVLTDIVGTVIAQNDDWTSSANQQEIQASGAAPPNSLEPAILLTLDPGKYTPIVSGAASSTGVAIVEIFVLRGGVIPQDCAVDPTGNWEITVTLIDDGCDFQDPPFTFDLALEAIDGQVFQATSFEEDLGFCWVNPLTCWGDTVEETEVEANRIADCTVTFTDTLSLTLTSATEINGTETESFDLTGTCDLLGCPPDCSCVSTYSVSGTKGGPGPDCNPLAPASLDDLDFRR